MSSFSIPLSGLTASSTELSTVANNLANLNTIGYKDEGVQFSDLFYENLGTDGAGDPIQQGTGTAVSSEPANFTEGNLTQTGVSTDVAIDGNGFFIVQNSAGVQSYTRAGNFEVGTDNLLETTDGQQVMGYAATNGVVSTSGGLSTLALGAGITSPAVVTSNLTLTSNLDAAAADGSTYSTAATIYDSLGGGHQVTFTYTNADSPAVAAQTATGTLSSSGVAPTAGDQVTVGNTTYTFETTIGGGGVTANQVLIGASATASLGNLVNAINGNTDDSNGDGAAGYGSATLANSEVTAVDTTPGSLITLSATTTGAAGNSYALTGGGTLTASGSDLAGGVAAVPGVVNIWNYAVTLPAGDVSGATGPITLASGTLSFSGNGTLASVTPKGGAASTSNPTIQVPPTGTPQAVFADGANPLSFNWNLFSNGVGNITQTAAANSTTSTLQDGSSSGTLENFSIGSNGTITGSFSNGTTGVLGQIALANFADQQGLSHLGNNDFAPTLASGQASIGAPGSGGLGSVSGGSLEQSNVNIATEFSNLIVAQSSYEANAKVVTTLNQIEQDTINIKQ